MEGTISFTAWLYYIIIFYYSGGSLTNTMVYNLYPKEIPFHREKNHML